MYLLEYQAKEVLAQHGVPIPAGRVARTPEEAEAAASAIESGRYAVKAQIHAGGRGLAGGVQFAPSPRGVRDAAAKMLGTRLVTEQTAARGEAVAEVYVEATIEAPRNLYLGVVVDQRMAALTLLGSREGGVDFEARAQDNPDIVRSLALPSNGDLDEAGIDNFLAALDLDGDAAANAKTLIAGTVRAFIATDASLVEINPLAIAANGQAIAVDAKMVLDNSAAFRHPEFEDWERDGEFEEIEAEARKNDINFVKMDGDIGMVVNGAGLALATHDMVVEAGGRPANFMDIRTTTLSLQIARGIGLLISDPGVKAILVNIHGGGMTGCDTIAEAIGFAVTQAKRDIPIVVRFAGQNADYARQLLRDRRVPHESVATIGEAVKRAVALAGGGT